MLRKLSFQVLFPFVLASAIGPLSATAQQSSPDVPSITIRANTRLVVVDVVVKDKKGQPVTGLTASDFTVEENGKKQKIATLTPPGGGQTAPQPLPPGLLTNKAEYIRPAGIPTVLVLDAANSHFLDQSYGRNQMLKYVLEQSGTGSPMAVMALTNRLEVLQDFTADRRVLLTAIKRLQPQEPILQPLGSPPPPTPVESPLGRGPGAASAPSGAPDIAPDLVAVSQAQIASFETLALGYLLDLRTEVTIQALHELSRVLGGFPGRKNVVWLTADFPFSLIPQNTNMSDAEVIADLPSVANARNNVMVNAGGRALAEMRGRYDRQIQEAEFAVASAGIAVYPVDMRGLMASGIDVNTTSSLEELASQTGGKAYVNQNEIKYGIALAAADEKASYSLAYYPDNKKWDGKFRALKVKLDQKDCEVRYRKGYFAFDPAVVKNPHFDSDVAEALGLNAPATQVSFMAQAKPTGPGKVRVMFLVDAHTLSADDASGGKKMDVSLYACIYTASGKSLETRSTKVDRTFDAATYQQIVDKGMMVPIDLEVPAGGQDLRLAVLDNKTGFIGTASGPLGK